MYPFKHKNLDYGKGGLAELIAYDRYVLTDKELSRVKPNDTVIYSLETKGTQLVGTVIENDPHEMMLTLEAHNGSGMHTVHYDLCRLVLETRPVQLWERWARGAASVEREELMHPMYEQFAWLLDGFQYVPGGRIQAMLGHEYAGFNLEKSNLSSYNCLVLPSPDCDPTGDPLWNWVKILGIARREANSMSYGCGVGINVSTVPEVIESPIMHPTQVYFHLDQEHPERASFGETVFQAAIQMDEVPMGETRELIIVEDSRFGIFDALESMVIALYKGRDIFMDFSLLRPKGAYVKGINGMSSGAVSWIRLFDFTLELLRKPSVNAVDIAEFFALIPQLISQGGQRRGALMIVLNVNHPNIREFIYAKSKAGRINGANLSVNLTEDFMTRVETGDPEACVLFDEICTLAWQCAEPGILFMDRANALSNTNGQEVIDATNPCGEQPLPPNGVCNLGAFNLPMFMYQTPEGKWAFDYSRLSKACALAVRFQDNIVDYGAYFDEEIKKVQTGDRRVGIGTMGLATVLIRAGLKYGSPEAMEFTTNLYRLIAEEVYTASILLGEEKGSYPNYDPEKISPTSFLYKLTGGKLPKHMRNAGLLTQAPTGSTGTMVDSLPGYECSTGIEPYFSFTYFRASRLGVSEQVVGLVQEWKDAHPGKSLPDFFVAAQDIPASDHVRMQGVIQQWVDSSISKTINMPNHATVTDVKEAYLAAYNLGLKGCTVYRDGSRSAQVLATKKEDAKIEDVPEKKAPVAEVAEERVEVVKEFHKRPRVLTGRTVKQNSPFGKMYVTINSANGTDIEEVFIQLGQVGSDIRAIVDSVGILLTLALSDRLSGLSPEKKLQWLTRKLIGIKGANSIGFGPNRVDSLPDALGRVLKEYMETDAFEMTEHTEEEFAAAPVADICPSCGAAAVRRVEGCEKCTACGAAKCG